MTDRLHDYFRRHANPRGLVLARESRLIEELRTTGESIAAAMTQLEVDKKIQVLSQFPYTVVALKPRPWSGSNPSRVRKVQQFSSKQRSLQEEVPVSSSIAAAAIQQREDRGAGEGEALLDEVLLVLGPDADREEFNRVLSGRSPELIRRCLRRVEATKVIRVSKAALFRTLLEKLSH